jgi:hypothetical protein
MCLIINRPANTELDFEKFKVAMINNPDGWGLSAADGSGKLITYRSPEEADPEKLFRFVQEEYKELPVLLHLRYTTVGKTTLRNAHPFPILEHTQDGVDLRMAHNGTLHAYKGKNDGSSDTRNFVRVFVRPLFKRLIRGMTTEEILKDGWIHTLVNSELTTLSVVSFIDGYGNSLNVNATGNGGFTDENGVYYSNKYSFDPDHRLPATYQSGYYRGWTNTKENTKADNKSDKGGAVVPFNTGKDHALDTKQKKFSDLYELTDPVDLVDITDELIDYLVDSEPEDAKLLIKELLYEWSKSMEEGEAE